MASRARTAAASRSRGIRLHHGHGERPTFWPGRARAGLDLGRDGRHREILDPSPRPEGAAMTFTEFERRLVRLTRFLATGRGCRGAHERPFEPAEDGFVYGSSVEYEPGGRAGRADRDAASRDPACFERRLPSSRPRDARRRLRVDGSEGDRWPQTTATLLSCRYTPAGTPASASVTAAQVVTVETFWSA